jgi:truncated hemoglobin YjbI
VPPSKKEGKLDKMTTYSSLAKSPSDGYQNK